MHLKRILLTPLLFAQMWVGATAMGAQEFSLQENISAVTLKVSQPIVSQHEETYEMLALCLMALLVAVLYFSKSILSKASLVNFSKFTKVKPFKFVLPLLTSKKRNAYYWHFYSSLNLLKSA